MSGFDQYTVGLPQAHGCRSWAQVNGLVCYTAVHFPASPRPSSVLMCSS